MYILIKKYQLKYGSFSENERKPYHFVCSKIGFKYKRSQFMTLVKGMNYFEL